MAGSIQSLLSCEFRNFTNLPNELQTQIVLNNIQNQHATMVKCVEILGLHEAATIRTVRPQALNAAALVDKVMRGMHEKHASRNTIYRFHVDGADLLSDVTEDTVLDEKWASAIGPLHVLQRAEIIVDYHVLCESPIARSSINIRRSVHNLVYLLLAFIGVKELNVVFLCSGSYEKLLSSFVVVEEEIKKWKQVEEFSLIIAEETPVPEDSNGESTKPGAQQVIAQSAMTDSARKVRRARPVTVECIHGHVFRQSMPKIWDLDMIGHVTPESLRKFCRVHGYPWTIEDMEP